jgi:chromosomal replication initiator protein
MSKDQFTFDDTDESVRLGRAWDNVADRLANKMSTAWFDRFIRPLKPVNLRDHIVSISSPGRFVMDWVRSRYLDTIQEFLEEELCEEITVEFDVTPQDKNALTSPQFEPGPSPIAEGPFRPNEKYTFDNYVVGQSNRMAFAGAKSVAADPGGALNPLFVYSPPGLGKTHLMHAIARELLRTNPRFPLVYISAQQFTEDFVSALQNNRMDKFRRSQRQVTVWLVEDIQHVAGKDKTQEEIFHTYNYLHSLGKQIVLTSDRPPRELYFIEDRLRGRFESGLVADIQMPDTETRCAIALSKAQQMEVELPHDVALYLAETVPGSIRTLEGSITRLAVQASVCAMPINLELAVTMVEQHYRGAHQAKPPFRSIVEAVGRLLNIPVDDILGTSRKAPIVHARHIAVFVTREITGDSWKHIGSQFGDRDHTSMMHGYGKIRDMIHRDRDLRSTVKSLIRQLHPPT